MHCANQRHTWMVTLFVYAPYVYWKMGAHRNAKLVFHWYCWLVVPQYSITPPAISCLIMLQVLQHTYLPPMSFLFFSHAPCTPCYHAPPMHQIPFLCSVCHPLLLFYPLLCANYTLCCSCIPVPFLYPYDPHAPILSPICLMSSMPLLCSLCPCYDPCSILRNWGW